jgi:hypothetical protein
MNFGVHHTFRNCSCSKRESLCTSLRKYVLSTHSDSTSDCPVHFTTPHSWLRLGVSSSLKNQYWRTIFNSLSVSLSFSSHPHSCISFLFSSRVLDYNKPKVRLLLLGVILRHTSWSTSWDRLYLWSTHELPNVFEFLGLWDMSGGVRGKEYEWSYKAQNDQKLNQNVFGSHGMKL